MNPEQIKEDWNSRGYSFGVFSNPPGQVCADFVHRTDELKDGSRLSLRQGAASSDRRRGIHFCQCGSYGQERREAQQLLVLGI